MSDTNINRRAFLNLTLVTGTGLCLAPALAKAEELPQLAETDPTAVALGYKHDAGKVDAAKYPTFKAGQNCAGCKLVLGKDGETWRPCGIFPGKAVAAAGWCSAFVAKA